MTSLRPRAFLATPIIAVAVLSTGACSSTINGMPTAGSAHVSGSGAASSAPGSAGAPASAPVPSAPGGSSTSGGSGSGAPPSDAKGLAALLQNGKAHITTAHLQLRVDSTEVITGSGDEKLDHGRVVALQVTEKLAAIGQLKIVIVGGKTYVKLPGALNKGSKPYHLVSGTSSDPTIRQLAGSLSSVTSSATSNSTTAFIAAASSVTYRGMQTIDGVPALHYAIVVDTTKLPASYPNREALQAAGLTSFPVELWLDSLGRPVQTVENTTVAGQKVSSRYNLSKYNQPVSITAPPASQVSTS